MENTRCLLSKVKQNIRDVMKSLENPVATIWQFLDKYNTTFKEPVPYQRLGFQNFNQFVKSIGDVVTVHFVRGELLLTPTTANKRVIEEAPQKQQEVPSDMKPKVLTLLNWYDKGIALSEFGQRYEKLHGKLDPPISQEKWREILLDLKIAELRENDIVFAAPPQMAEVEPSSQNDVIATTTKKRTIEMAFVEESEPVFRKVLVNFKSGIEATKFPIEYQKIANAPLDYQKYGFSGMIDLATSLPGIFTLRKNKNGKGWLLFETKIKPRETFVREEFFPRKENVHNPPAILPEIRGPEASPEAIDQESIMKKVTSWKCCTAPSVAPDDAVVEISELRIQTIPPDKKVNDYLGVYVSYVYDPSSIWLQLRGAETSVALDKLMDELEKCYNSPDGDRYKIPFANIIENINVAAIYPVDNNWHRGMVTKVYETEVDVFFYDYGNNSRVDLDNVRYLRASYLKLPAQAIPAELPLIAPINGVWDPAVNKKILELSTDKPLTATIVAINDSQLLSVFLCDTTGEDDVFLDDVLVKEGFAIPKKLNGV